MADAYGFVGALLLRLRYRDNGDNSYSPLVSLGPGQPPEYEGGGALTAPSLNRQIASTGTLAGGRYRVVVYAYSDDTPGLGKNLQLVLDLGGRLRVLVGPVGALLAWDLPDVSITAGHTIFIQNGAAGAAGTTYYGYIAAYPLP